MPENTRDALARWAIGLLIIIAIIISALWIFSVVAANILLPGQKLTTWPSIVPTLLVWGALLFGSIGLRATSSILASILSMLYLGAGGLMLFTPGPYRFFGFLPILFAVFLYLYSTKTWALHEKFWLKVSSQKAEGNRAS